ncbi:MAG: hypothetical protein M3498_06410, partial [Deinococcota bacterium]|nr:hypothetical protein [Deinococcota bacterium]
MLEVIENEQHPALADKVDKLLKGFACCLLSEAEMTDEARGYQTGVTQRVQGDEVHAASER